MGYEHLSSKIFWYMASRRRGLLRLGSGGSDEDAAVLPGVSVL